MQLNSLQPHQSKLYSHLQSMSCAREPQPEASISDSFAPTTKPDTRTSSSFMQVLERETRGSSRPAATRGLVAPPPTYLAPNPLEWLIAK